MASSRNSNRVEEDAIDMNDDMDDDGLEDIPIGEDGEATIETGSQSGVSKKRKKGSARSDHWKGFTLMWVEEGDPPEKTRKGKCKTCGAVICADSYRNGTNGLKNHTISCSKKHKNTTEGQTVLHFTPASTDGTSSLSAWKFDQKFVRLTLAEMIILDELPFTHVEKEGFQKFVAAACPMFQIPIRADCVKIFLERKDRLKTFFTKKGMGRAH
ncbi:uncharacterized protein LOC130997861 [Salvia miltiorrhiza]|uniref:uncharacterized protein LOC130997861 n=1 Tax=Salvia miltiorrhiza TaxID=226208 RepID=UPI0025AC2884|nr:uncharacterized protein LOC130997861 [Salvia miltiorrhiza]